jgi:hypothetical protein
MTCPRCQQDNPSHAKFCLECGAPLKAAGDSRQPAASYGDLLEQQAATSEIPRVISTSPAARTIHGQEQQIRAGRIRERGGASHRCEQGGAQARTLMMQNAS